MTRSTGGRRAFGWNAPIEVVLLRVAEVSRQRKCRNPLVSGCSVDAAACFLSGPLRIQGVRDLVLGCIDFFSGLLYHALLRTARQCKGCSNGDDSGKKYAQVTCSLSVISCSCHSRLSPFMRVLRATAVPRLAFVTHNMHRMPSKLQILADGNPSLLLRGTAPICSRRRNV